MSSIFRMEIDIESSDRFGIGPWSPPSGSAGTFMFCWRVRRPEFLKGLEPFCQVTVNDRDGIQNSCHKIYYVYITYKHGCRSTGPCLERRLR